MLYNIYVRHMGNNGTEYVIGVTESQLQKLINAFNNGETAYRINGRLINLDNPEVFCIYDIDVNTEGHNLLGKDERQLKRYIQDYGLAKEWGIDFDLLKEFGDDVTDEKLDEYGNEEEAVAKKDYLPKKKTGKIFISHSSTDKELANSFVERILRLGLGMPHENIFCTSIDSMKVESGIDFKQKIRAKLLESEMVFQIITEAYPKSEICLNEMGAAWVLCDMVIPLIVPPMNYQVGFINSNIEQLKIDHKPDLLRLYQDHKSFFTSVNSVDLDAQIDSFIKSLVPNKKGKTVQLSDFFSGVWSSYGNKRTEKRAIKDPKIEIEGNKYLVNGEYKFRIEEFSHDQNSGVITFFKVEITGRRKLKNELTIISPERYLGIESEDGNGEWEIEYLRLT